MKTAEFDRWWKDLAMRFPSVDAWLVRVHPSTASQRQLLRSWYGVLEDVTLADAMDVTLAMQAGDLEWPGGGEGSYGFEERLPQHVRRLARQMAWERDRTAAVDSGPQDYRPTDFPAGKILRRLLELTDKGMPAAEARQIVLSEIPLGRPAYEPRYSCLTCLDSGRVNVASNAAIEAMLLGRFAECHHRDAVMRCSCSAGQRLKRKQYGRDVPFETYSEAADFRVVDPLWREPEVQRFAEWVAAQRNERADSIAQTHAGYEPAFAEFGS